MLSLLRRVLLVLLLPLMGLAQAATFLQPDQAFRFSARLINEAGGSVVEVHYRIAPGYYMYRDQFKFAVAEPARMAAPVFPAAKIKFDETFNRDEAVYRDAVTIRVPVVAATGTLQLTSISQGCADAGLCYAPQEARASLVPVSAGGFSDEGAHLAATLQSGNVLAIIALFYGLGVLLSFTPCVLPMVPILSSLIVGQQTHTPMSRSKAFLLALSYTLGMALVYTALGIAAGLAGEGLAAQLQTPWVLGVSAALMVVFALSMFDIYTLQMPRAIQNVLSQRFGHQRGGHFAGVFAMGAVSALIVGPCMAAPLAGALVYISQTRDTVLGGLALFALAIGMGTPLLLLGASAGAVLPRVGRWMESVKYFFGVLLIATAIWLVSPVLAVNLQMAAWAALLLVCAGLLGVFRGWPRPLRGRVVLTRLTGLAFLVASAVWAAGALRGGDDVLAPLTQAAPVASKEIHLVPGVVGSAAAPVFERVRSVAELDRLLAAAGKPVMLDFYADWCVSCKEMERFTYTDARVAEHFGRMRLVQVDVTANNDDDRALLKRFALFGPPGIIFFDQGGRVIDNAAVIGFQDADRFLVSLGRVLP